MHHFAYRHGALFAEDVDLAAIAEDVGTPFYCYCEATLRRHARVFRDAVALPGRPEPLVAFAVKANANLAVLRILASEGLGADVVSGGELQRARAAGIPADKIVFSGVGKTRAEMALALEAGVYQFNVESEPELDALDEVARGLGRRAPIALRINPDVSAGGHAKISTGKAEDKFGVAWDAAPALYAKAERLGGIDVKGVDVHIGSQITELQPFQAAFDKIAGLVRSLRADGIAIERLDLGGGLGIPYDEGSAVPPAPDAYADLISRVDLPSDVRLVFEPGRMIAGNAGVLVSRVVYVKEGAARRFAILDAGMNDLIRPALYDAHHEIKPLRTAAADAPKSPYDFVGPVCETGDAFALGRASTLLSDGDLVAIMSAGAYGAVQASEYNARPRVPETLVSGSRWAVVRRRPTFEEAIAFETAPDWLD